MNTIFLVGPLIDKRGAVTVCRQPVQVSVFMHYVGKIMSLPCLHMMFYYVIPAKCH